MHSRSFLHRLSDTPLASAAEVEPVEHRPLGFADVRSSEQATSSRPRRPLGFVVEQEPRFVTEMSFRRTPTATRGADVMPPARGVESTTADTAAPAVGQASGLPEHVTPVAMAGDDKVPFYKRELTLRRRKPEDELTTENVEALETDESADSKPIGFAWDDDKAEPEVEEIPAVEETIVETDPVVVPVTAVADDVDPDVVEPTTSL